jgi:hypothetical protein
LGKAYNINDGDECGYDCFQLLGCVTYDEFDKQYIDETIKAIEWVRRVRNNWYNWSCYPPSVPELYPNMNNKNDAPYHKVKKQIAEKIHEITEIYMVSVKHRHNAHGKKIFGWNNPKCTSENLGIYGKKIGPIVDAILNINRSTLGPNVLPVFIENNLLDWQSS